jgi:O-antigen/teichoic acid export membrane protein
MASPDLVAAEPDAATTFADRVRRAVLWRSGSQMVAQAIQWAATFLVIRILDPRDYGLFAMCQVVLALMALLNGYGVVSGFVQAREVDARAVRQLFGMLLLLNGAIALAQVAVSPLAASYYREPQVGTLLRVQALLFLTTPFIALPQALLARRMEFRIQARANIVASVASAATALGGALAGWGVWTLVAAPAAMYLVRAAMLTVGARALVRPSFDFRGAGWLARFGGVMAASQLFWFVQSQADVFIAGRHLPAHALGLYTTALFLAQIFTAKVVPPLNEVAFTAYARLGPDHVAPAFLRATRAIMAAALPFYLGLAVTAEPLVLTVLGAKWLAAVPLVRLLALAMPFMTLQILLAPACDAVGRPGVGVRNGAVGAVLLAIAFTVGVQMGVEGLALSWLVAYPLFLGVSLARALPVLGVKAATLARAVAPLLPAALAMALGVWLLDQALPPVPPALRLAILVATGAAIYGAVLATVARSVIAELVTTVRGRRRS